MAKSTVPVNFKDDIMNSAMGGKRRYRMINNSDGTISLEDVTTYDQVGSNFGAAQINATNQAVNAAADEGKIIDDLDAINNVTKEGYMAGALALKQVNSNLEEQPQFVYDENGQITGYTTKIGGADTVFPFKSNDLRTLKKNIELHVSGTTNSDTSIYLTQTTTISLNDISDYRDLTNENIIIMPTRFNSGVGTNFSIVSKSYDNITGVLQITCTANNFWNTYRDMYMTVDILAI